MSYGALKHGMPAERERGLRFMEVFQDPSDVAKNGGVVVGTVPIVRGRGAYFNGAAGNYITFGAAGLLNKPVVNIAVDLDPEFALNDGVNHYILDSPAGNRFVVYKNAANALYVDWAGVVAVSSGYATYSPYWNAYGRNTLVCAISSGASYLYLNGVLIGSNAAAFGIVNPAIIYVGSGNAGTNNFAGYIQSVRIFTGTTANDLLTQQEARDYYTGETFQYQKKAILSLPMRIAQHDATNGRTLDISNNQIHANFPGGAANPTKIANQRGYTFDGGDYLTGACLGAFNRNSMTIALLISPSFAADDGVVHFLFDTDAALRNVILKQGVGSANVLQANFGNTVIFQIPLATYGPYWRQNQYNCLLLNVESGNNQCMLNKIIVGTNATAWNAVNPISYWIGTDSGISALYSGRYYKVEAFNKRLSTIQALDWQIRAMAEINKL